MYKAIAIEGAANANAPMPRSLPHRECLQTDESDNGIVLAHVTSRRGGLPQITSVKSGWELPGAPPLHKCKRIQQYSALEYAADFPPEDFKSLQPPAFLGKKGKGEKEKGDMDKKPAKLPGSSGSTRVPLQLQQVVVHEQVAQEPMEDISEGDLKKAMQKREERRAELRRRVAKSSII